MKQGAPSPVLQKRRYDMVFGKDRFALSRYGQPVQSERPATAYVPDLSTMIAQPASELRDVVERFASDRDALLRFYSVQGSSLQLLRMREFYHAWQSELEGIAYEQLSLEGSIDWHLLNNKLRHLLMLMAREQSRQQEIAPILPIVDDISALQEARRRFEKVHQVEISKSLTDMAAALKFARAHATAGQSVALRAANCISDLKKTLADWFGFYDGYDPLFSWWCRVPYKSLVTELEDHERFLRETIVGHKPGEDEPIVGDPIGLEGLLADLEHEMIAYTPDELIALAEREMSWCHNEWRKVAAELGLADNWQAALRQAKEGYVLPGEQPTLIASQAYEAIACILERDLLTVPPLAIDVWRMSMLSKDAQKVSPFFLGGELLQVAFPTETMDHAEKLSSLLANNIHLARATVHHELIPGHHMQMFMCERHNKHRKLFNTPFWVEGWALWWEFRLWDIGFPQSAHNRGGMLFWRTHRCARIIFSLNFHLGKWTPDQCIDFLVEQVGHDRHTAESEVRRSFNGNYPPLYQAAYMIGAIQMRALFEEFVLAGALTEKEFHDGIIHGNMMPIELVRARLCSKKLAKNHRTCWRF